LRSTVTLRCVDKIGTSAKAEFENCKVGTMAGISDDINDMKVSRDDFMHALEEVHPAFGVSEEELQQVVQNGIIHFNNDIEVSSLATAIVEIIC
jgi:hypothetical protein